MYSALVLVLAAWLAPVVGPVERRFDRPAHAWSPGHRGIDLAVAPASPVGAAAAGVVVFGGPVAGGLSVTVSHPGGLRSSYSFLASVAVSPGQRVKEGEVLGLSGGRGPGHGPGVVHFSVRGQRGYLDPLLLLGQVAPVHLVPLGGRPAPGCPRLAHNPGPVREIRTPAPNGGAPRRPAGGG